jgi:hypothetical protein
LLHFKEVSDSSSFSSLLTFDALEIAADALLAADLKNAATLAALAAQRSACVMGAAVWACAVFAKHSMADTKTIHFIFT